MPIIDHISLSVTDLDRAKAFYAKALAPLGIGVAMEIPKSVTGDVDIVGIGRDRKGELWLAPTGLQTPPTHIAFLAASRAEVDAFYVAAIAAGGQDNGAPGLRPHYHATYYGAFVLDPDGHNIEAVCHKA
jgi:catechol 2,3-dioxygenase-like lactoylglutathione lyase family enzyme